ncbi:MAG: hypothetical protein ACFCUJ_08740 [Thiotrichales bacterium]
MSNESLTLALQKLGNRYLSAYAENAERAAAFWSGALQKGSGGTTLESLPTRYAEFVRQEAPRVMREIAEAGLNYYALVLNTGAESVSRFYAQVLVVESRAKPAQTSAAPRSRTALSFNAAPGAVAVNAFLVTNHRAEAIDVIFGVSELVSDDGTPPLIASVTFTPAQCRIGPRSEQVVQCRVTFPDDIRPGVDYRGQIQVTGFPELAMSMIVRAEAARVTSMPPIPGGAHDATVAQSVPAARKRRAKAKPV